MVAFCVLPQLWVAMAYTEDGNQLKALVYEDEYPGHSDIMEVYKSLYPEDMLVNLYIKVEPATKVYNKTKTSSGGI